MRFWFGVLVIGLAGCAGAQDTNNSITHVTGTDTAQPDTEGPTIKQDNEVTSPQPYGEDILLAAHAKDNTDGAEGVIVLDVYYQQETAIEWKKRGMTRVGGDLWQGSIPGADVGSGGMRYYLSGVDEFDNTGCDPEKCDQAAFHFPVSH